VDYPTPAVLKFAMTLQPFEDTRLRELQHAYEEEHADDDDDEGEESEKESEEEPAVTTKRARQEEVKSEISNAEEIYLVPRLSYCFVRRRIHSGSFKSSERNSFMFFHSFKCVFVRVISFFLIYEKNKKNFCANKFIICKLLPIFSLDTL
jgi:hypothetical protein